MPLTGSKNLNLIDIVRRFVTLSKLTHNKLYILKC